MRPDRSGRLLAAQSDQQLLALVHDGHERAFEALVRRYRRPLLRYCRRLHLSHARAEDVLQHAFLQAWLALARGAQVRDLKPWLYRIVHNTAVNAIRDARREHLSLSGAAGAGALAGEPHPGEPQHERRAAARSALSQVAALPDMQRRALVLSALDGHSRDEVASALGISDDAVRGLLYRARRTLRDAAAAIVPQPLIGWAFAGAGRVAATGAGAGELSGGLGPNGAAGMLAKGAAVALTAGALATGAAVLHLPRHARHEPPPTASSARPAGAGASGERAPIGTARAAFSSSQGERPAGLPGGPLTAGVHGAGRTQALRSTPAAERRLGAFEPLRASPRRQGARPVGDGRDFGGAGTPRDSLAAGAGAGAGENGVRRPAEQLRSEGSGAGADHRAGVGADGSPAPPQSTDHSGGGPDNGTGAGSMGSTAGEGRPASLSAEDGPHHAGAGTGGEQPARDRSGGSGERR
jgi:RNA polymerase sigma factor (sigma-70 family)